MNLQEMMAKYHEYGLSDELAAARVCQDIVLKAIAESPLSHNVTIKGGVVMRSITQNNRRATRDIDLDFIHYSLNDESIKNFIQHINCVPNVTIRIEGNITELKHQDYHGKSVAIAISDEFGMVVRSKIDIGVHKHFEIEQEEYCFDVCMDENGVCLLKNSVEQSFAEKLRSLLIFGSNSRRYKDIYDLFYLKDIVNTEKLNDIIGNLIFKDKDMRENTMNDIVKRIAVSFKDELYLKRVSESRQRWMDNEIHEIANGIVEYLQKIR